MAGSTFAQMNQQTSTSRAETRPDGQGVIHPGIDQDTNDRRANDVVGEIERIGDQSKCPQISRRLGSSRARRAACSGSRRWR